MVVAPGGGPSMWPPPDGPMNRPYLSQTLMPMDAKDYSAAGLLAYRATSSSIDVLLGRQMSRGKGPSRRGTWSWIGGKREPDESDSIVTAAREAHEESLGYITSSWVETQLRAEPTVLWQPVATVDAH